MHHFLFMSSFFLDVWQSVLLSRSCFQLVMSAWSLGRRTSEEKGTLISLSSCLCCRWAKPGSQPPSHLRLDWFHLAVDPRDVMQEAQTHQDRPMNFFQTRLLRCRKRHRSRGRRDDYYIGRCIEKPVITLQPLDVTIECFLMSGQLKETCCDLSPSYSFVFQRACLMPDLRDQDPQANIFVDQEQSGKQVDCKSQLDDSWKCHNILPEWLLVNGSFGTGARAYSVCDVCTLKNKQTFSSCCLRNECEAWPQRMMKWLRSKQFAHSNQDFVERKHVKSNYPLMQLLT